MHTAAGADVRSVPVDQGLIFDIGAHVGQDTDFYLQRGFRVVAVEADPDLARRLRARFGIALARGHLVVVEAAVGARSGAGKFYRLGPSLIGTALPARATWSLVLGEHCEEIDVAFVTLADLIARYGKPHYMKIDIERAVTLCSDGLRDAPTPSYLSLEAESRDFERFKRDVAAIGELGYDRFQLVRRQVVPRQRIPDPPFEGRAVQYQFA